ncbi:MAG: hypothetical protein ACJ77Z_17980 [Thermoleophilaceae bacterium]
MKIHFGPGARALHLPNALRAGKRRLKRDHYVLGMTATTGSASAAASLELVVK